MDVLLSLDVRRPKSPVPLVSALALGLVCIVPNALAVDAAFLKNGRAGFVVSDIAYALSEDGQRACPKGFSQQTEEIFAATPAGKRKPGETDEAYAARLGAGGRALWVTSTGQNTCQYPEAAPPDPSFRTMNAPNAAAYGIDLDGTASAAASGGQCAHDDFDGFDGSSGIDNQFYRAVGCSRSFLSTGLSNLWGSEMLTGAWGVLITLDGVDDLHNDASVDVGIYANADPIRLSPTRAPLEYATYAVDQDPRFRVQTHGRIDKGVLTTDPADIRLRHVTASMRLERVLRDARLQLTISPQGRLEGFLAGYAPVEATYNLQFGYRDGKDGNGEVVPERRRAILSSNAARVLGYTCPGAYQALHRLADGHPDSATGQCTSISTQYKLKAIPAFVVDVSTQSSNVKLDRNPDE